MYTISIPFSKTVVELLIPGWLPQLIVIIVMVYSVPSSSTISSSLLVKAESPSFSTQGNSGHSLLLGIGGGGVTVIE